MQRLREVSGQIREIEERTKKEYVELRKELDQEEAEG